MARLKPKRRRRDAHEQARLDFAAAPRPKPASDLDREVAEFVDETRREPLPGQGEMFEEKPCH